MRFKGLAPLWRLFTALMALSLVLAACDTSADPPATTS